jgi:hypothetical protein
VGTVLYALAIGPITHLTIPALRLRLRGLAEPAPARRDAVDRKPSTG